MVNLDSMQQMVWSMFARQTEQWPPELKRALANIEVDIVKKSEQITIVAKNSPGVESNPDIEKAKKVILDALMVPLPQVVGAFQCKVKVYQ